MRTQILVVWNKNIIRNNFLMEFFLHNKSFKAIFLWKWLFNVSTSKCNSLVNFWGRKVQLVSLWEWKFYTGHLDEVRFIFLCLIDKVVSCVLECLNHVGLINEQIGFSFFFCHIHQIIVTNCSFSLIDELDIEIHQWDIKKRWKIVIFKNRNNFDPILLRFVGGIELSRRTDDTLIRIVLVGCLQ